MIKSYIRLLQALLRYYPIRLGKGFLATTLFPNSELPDGEIVTTREGIKVIIHPDWMYKWLYLYREYEPEETAVFKRIVRKGDLCFDVGANFGYYSCLFAKAGATVHGFEPLPSNFLLNQETVKLNRLEAEILTNNIGLGASPGEFTIFSFEGLSNGHASATTLGRQDARPHICKITTLDEYCDKARIKKIDFMKMDIEGHELECLKGGATILSGLGAPIIHFEVNAECLKDRGLDANEILNLLSNYGYTRFYRISKQGRLVNTHQSIVKMNCDYVAFKDSHDLRIKQLI
jgi:FkbM family methyltransferase